MALSLKHKALFPQDWVLTDKVVIQIDSYRAVPKPPASIIRSLTEGSALKPLEEMKIGSTTETLTVPLIDERCVVQHSQIIDLYSPKPRGVLSAKNEVAHHKKVTYSNEHKCFVARSASALPSFVVKSLHIMGATYDKEETLQQCAATGGHDVARSLSDKNHAQSLNLALEYMRSSGKHGLFDVGSKFVSTSKYWMLTERLEAANEFVEEALHV